MSTQKNHLNEMVLLSTHNMFLLRNKKIIETDDILFTALFSTPWSLSNLWHKGLNALSSIMSTFLRHSMIVSCHLVDRRIYLLMTIVHYIPPLKK